MGYELHITRKEVWSDETGSDITTREWTSLNAGDPEMRPMRNGDMTWVRYSKHVPGRKEAKFRVGSSGDIVVTRPDQEMRAKMYRVALKIGGKVQGDDGELYDEKGEVIASSRPFYKGGLFVVLMSVVGAGLLIYFGLKAALGLLLVCACILMAEVCGNLFSKKRG